MCRKRREPGRGAGRGFLGEQGETATSYGVSVTAIKKCKSPGATKQGPLMTSEEPLMQLGWECQLQTHLAPWFSCNNQTPAQPPAMQLQLTWCQSLTHTVKT